MKTKTIEQIREMGRKHALARCWEFGDSAAPDAGWDAWLIRQRGTYGTCDCFGEPRDENRGPWSAAMLAKLQAYHEGGLQGAAEYLRAVADADADAATGTDWADSKNPADPS